MSNIPKRPPTVAPPNTPSGPVSGRPGVPGTPSQRPSNVRDALTEAHAVAGGAFGKVSAPAPRSSPGRKTVMLVDDDPSMRARLRAALEPFYDVIEAKDGMEAVEMSAGIQPPAMIVSDVMMPRVDGFTLAKILRGNPVTKRVPIMFVSARHSPQDVTQALVLGACHYFPKTTPIGDIVAKIRKIIP
jgi:CheY-like chemotaxis protein